MSKNIYGKCKNYLEWQKKYSNEKTLDIYSYFTEEQLNMLQKLFIKIEKRLYSEREFFQFEMYLYDAFEKTIDGKMIQGKVLKSKNITLEQYKTILDIFHKISLDNDY